MSHTHLRNYIQLHLVVLAWGLTAILGKLIDLPPVDVVVWRTTLAVVCFVGVALVCRHALKVPLPKAAAMIGVGAILGLHWVLFFWSARLATASVCLAAMPTAMLWCSLIEPLIDGSRRWRPAELLVGAVMVGAVWLIYQVEFRYWQGFSVAIAAAVLAAFFATMSKQQVSREMHWSVIGSYQMAGACLAALFSRPWLEGGLAPAIPHGPSIIWVGLLGLVCTAAAYAAFMDVLRRVSVFTVNVVYNMEPVYGIVLAALIFGRSEFMSSGFYAGASVIIALVLALPRIRRWVEK
ncbi:DMT family transporter [Prosthecobacter vanneervenii]|uniref:Drug/metabolite transporter (DMT)-like permease n=1 Tax=Prosthecobacter vanneervenii TaxID=48466 RepID=A0A7W7YEN7_9BACT|nr:EamA family transporter [Prosthecobacter vanneervenii]MBB5034796.1 drug/metabolite transporter (DMT)-like permease [Prosthecobacter vanneervenii]